MDRLEREVLVVVLMHVRLLRVLKVLLAKKSIGKKAIHIPKHSQRSPEQKTNPEWSAQFRRGCRLAEMDKSPVNR
jgi:hypothetical protein